MRDFAAIDFETANNERTSVCSVGVVIVRNGEMVDSIYSVIQPEPNYTTIGVHRCTALLVMLPTQPLYSLRCGDKLNR